MDLALFLASDEEILGIIFGIGGTVAVMAIIFGTIQKVSETKHREQTKREVAAYIAEGSMTPEDGERIINAGGKKKSA